MKATVEKTLNCPGFVLLTPNVALGGTATQSSVWSHSGYHASPYVASYSNDGDYGTAFSMSFGKCSTTNFTPLVWWQVDLLKVYEISVVAITGKQNERKGFSEYFCLFYLPTVLSF